MSVSTTAKTYAGVLLDIGRAKGSLDALMDELVSFTEILAAEDQFRLFLAVPGIDKQTKRDFLQKTLGGKFSEDFVNFLCILVENDRQSEIDDIASAFRLFLDEEKQRARVTVVTSSALDSALRDQISSALAKRYNKSIVLEEQVDPSILGGIILKAGDTVIDGSVQTRVRAIRDKLLLSKIRGEAVYED
ncbi:MAG: ATP synthase F1 subunit delta [Spirochaetota bacterium]